MNSSALPPPIAASTFSQMASTSGFEKRPTAFNSEGGRFVDNSTYASGLGSTGLTPWVPSIPGISSSSSHGTHGRGVASGEGQPFFPNTPIMRPIYSLNGPSGVYPESAAANTQAPSQPSPVSSSRGDSSSSDRIIVAVTHDRTSYVNIDITSQVGDAQAIRHEIASKLQITDNPDVEFDIHRIVSAASTPGVPLDDNDLLVTCLEFGDERGALRLWVNLLSCTVPLRRAPHVQARPFSHVSPPTQPVRMSMPEPSLQVAANASPADRTQPSHHTDPARHIPDLHRSGNNCQDAITNPDGNVTMPELEHTPTPQSGEPDACRFSVPYYDEDTVSSASTHEATAPSHPSSSPPTRSPNIARNTIHSEPHEMTETELLQRQAEHPARESQAPDAARVGMISRKMTMDEVLNELHHHGCKNITPYLNRSMSGDSPVAGGGFGDVYRGELNDGTEVGLKCVRLEPNSDNEGRKKVKHAARELYIWSKCKHPNVLELIGVTQHRNQLAMVSPWMENGDLAHFLHTHPAVNRYNLCAQLAEGVAYLHEENVVHGDIKAANILVSKDHTLKITDFGTSSRNENTLQFTETTRSQSMSVRWTAPELISEVAEKSTKETDVFSLGMTILEIMTGTVPFPDMNQGAVVWKLVTGVHPPRPEAHIPTGNERADLLWSLLVSCWALKPEDRPTAIEVRDMMGVIALM